MHDKRPNPDTLLARVQEEEAHQSRGAKSGKGGHWAFGRAERREDQVEPNDIRLDAADLAQDTQRIAERIEAPAADHVELRQLRRGRLQLI